MSGGDEPPAGLGEITEETLPESLEDQPGSPYSSDRRTAAQRGLHPAACPRQAPGEKALRGGL